MTELEPEPSAILAWALAQIEAHPGAENYISMTLVHPDAPGLKVVVSIEREGKETPAKRAARLAEQVNSLRDDVFHASAEVDGLRTAIRAAIEALPMWSPNQTPVEAMATQVRTMLEMAGSCDQVYPTDVRIWAKSQQMSSGRS